MRSLWLAALSLLVLPLAGCLDYANEIVVNRDGSGEIHLQVVYTPKAINGLRAVTPHNPNGGKDLMALVLDKEQLAADAVRFGEGVTLNSVEAIENADGGRGFKAVYKFKDVAKLKFGELVLGQEITSAAQIPTTPIYSFAFEKGDHPVLTISAETAAVKGKKETSATGAEVQEQQLQKLQDMAQGLHLAFRIRVNGKIAGTDAAFAAKDQAVVTLLDFDANQVFADKEQALRLLQTKRSEIGKLPEMKIVGLQAEDPSRKITIRIE